MSDDPFITYHHATARFTMPVPSDWAIHEDPHEQVAVAAIAPGHEADFHSNVVVTVDELEPDRTIESWQEFTETTSAQVLDQYLLIDNETFEVDGHAVFRRLAHHANSGGEALTMEQWSTVRGRRGYTVTATTPTLGAYTFTGVFAAIAHGFRPDLTETHK